jgi:hypothetical protein
MTTDDVITQANVGGIAGPDLDLTALLRDKVLPEFLADVRTPAWRRKSATVTLAAGTRRYDLPNDFDVALAVYSSVDADPLEYIGEDPRKVLAAETATAGTVTGYLVETPAESGARHGLALSCPPDATGTLYLLYAKGGWMAEDGPVVDLDTVMPRRLHWALVEGLKREVYRERFGLGDARFQAAAAEFEAWKQRAANWREMGPAGAMVKTVR